jgi:hypothetical protein
MLDVDLAASYFWPYVEPYAPDSTWNYAFSGLAENGNPISPCTLGPVLCCQCQNGGSFCPDAVPEVCDAKTEMNNCIETALDQWAICQAGSWALFLLRGKQCLAKPPGPVQNSCITYALAELAITQLVCMLICMSAVDACRTAYHLVYNAAFEAACGGESDDDG